MHLVVVVVAGRGGLQVAVRGSNRCQALFPAESAIVDFSDGSNRLPKVALEVVRRWTVNGAVFSDVAERWAKKENPFADAPTAKRPAKRFATLSTSVRRVNGKWQ
ncbi:uncharacterized protein BP5553_02091 [Venustampulla echinocandica]|uniref:Uncharacterized protein n=1 Tax=Venustampulla echinocandica TaxID=2656787 RepID=A0A370U2V9_9HELO|nr:uncharacterized protein BP5553_02091 [Venustampulla echinocandica]RDL42112.1 hypothetical protein BP5553_02091 [Venustampulla echinocandica]